jgi:hypothetical protein
LRDHDQIAKLPDFQRSFRFLPLSRIRSTDRVSVDGLFTFARVIGPKYPDVGVMPAFFWNSTKALKVPILPRSSARILYVGNAGDDTVWVIDASSGVVRFNGPGPDRAPHSGAMQTKRAGRNRCGPRT